MTKRNEMFCVDHDWCFENYFMWGYVECTQCLEYASCQNLDYERRMAQDEEASWEVHNQ